MKDVDPLEAQPRQAAFERSSPRRRRCGRNRVGGSRTLVPTIDIGRLQRLQNAAEVLFRFAVAVLHRGVEIIDAGGDRARDGALLLGRIAAHHESADRAAAEAQHRELHSRAPKVRNCIALNSWLTLADTLAFQFRFHVR